MHLLFAVVLAHAARADSGQCVTLSDIDFNGHDLQPTTRREAKSPDECCGLCGNVSGCKVWTFMPPHTCYLKDSPTGQRPMPSYVSGCLGPCSPVPPPILHGGGACSSDDDCSLAGECHSGSCSCDAQFTGTHCAVLRLRKAKPNNGLQVNSTATHTWGGHAVKSSTGGKWVGFFSYMAAGCGLGSWQGNSMIIRATADDADGPFDQDMAAVTPPWTHNAMIARHPNGSYFLFHIGEGKPVRPLNNCSKRFDPLFPFPAGHEQPPPATTHIADDLSGPWRAAPRVPGVDNPAVFFFENGTTLLFSDTTVTWAASVDGDYEQTRTTVARNGTMRPEDPGVWRDARGHFHMLFNANSYHQHCKSGVPCGGHAWSRDGLSWSKPAIPAFGTIVHYTDGSTVTWDYVERPQVVQNDDATPLTLFLGQSYTSSHTLAIMFCQQGDHDCTTTIQ